MTPAMMRLEGVGVMSSSTCLVLGARAFQINSKAGGTCGMAQTVMKLEEIGVVSSSTCLVLGAWNFQMKLKARGN